MRFKTPIIVALVIAMTLQVSAFSDIRDERVRLSVNTLKSLEIIDGYDDGTYKPDNVLTRSAFVKMTVLAMRADDKLSTSKSFTVFSDVLPTHWALPYINVAVRDLKIISGFPDGTFRPEETITNAQAITICLSMLGYEVKDIGYFWPRDQVTKALALRLIDNPYIDPNASMTRGEAAVLLSNLLACEQKEGGKEFVDNFGSTAKSVLLVANSTTDLSMKEGLLKVIEGGKEATYNTATEIPRSHIGTMATLILNKDKNVIGVVPDDSIMSTYVVKEATKDGITDATGKFYSIAITTPLVANNKLLDYSKYINIKPGSGVNLIRDKNGNLLFVQTVVNTKSGTKHYSLKYSYETGKNPLLDFYSTEIVRNATFFKDGVPVSIEAMRKGDIVTLSEDQKTISASSALITGKLASAYPTLAKAQSVKIYDLEFPFAPTYTPDISNLEGKIVTIRLAADGNVALIEESTEGTINMVGVVTEISGTNAKVELSTGHIISGKTIFSSEMLGEYESALVKVRSNVYGEMAFERVEMSNSNYGTFDIGKMTYRNMTVSPLVKVFERASEYSGVTQIKLEDINSFDKKVDGSSVAYYETNNIGQITLIVLTNVTGDMFKYGKFEGTGENLKVSYFEGDKQGSTSGEIALNLNIRGPYGGLHIKGGAIRGFAPLTEAGKANAYAFDDEEVTVGGRIIKISDNAFVYDETKNTYMSIDDALDKYKEFKILVDKTVDTGGIVRMIVVK